MSNPVTHLSSASSLDEYPIDRNIPIPKGGKPSPSKYPFDKMNISESFSVSLGGRKSWAFIFAAIQIAQTKLGRKFTTRLIDENTRRVWRVF